MTPDSRQIEVTNLWKVFGANPKAALQPEHESMSREEIRQALGVVVGLRNVSFSVDRGQVFVVMGLSGSGKSTLVRCLIRLTEPTAGQVRFEGEDILAYSPKQFVEFRRSKVAMVFQHYGLLPHRNVIENVVYGLEVRGMEKQSRYRAALEAIRIVKLEGWGEKLPPGDERRDATARRPREGRWPPTRTCCSWTSPFSGLDPLIRREMQDELLALQSELQKTIVFITHDMNEALKMGDVIAIMRDGEIIQMGSPEEVVTLPTDAYVTDFVRDVSRARVIPAKAIMREPAVVVYERQGPRAALYAMSQHDLDAVFLIARDFTLKGVLTADEAKDMPRARERVPGRSHHPHGDDHRPPKCPSRRSWRWRPGASTPVAVVGGNGSLLGEIDRGTLLAGLSGTGADLPAQGDAQEGRRRPDSR